MPTRDAPVRAGSTDEMEAEADQLGYGAARGESGAVRLQAPGAARGLLRNVAGVRGLAGAQGKPLLPKTIARMYYLARSEADPLRALRAPLTFFHTPGPTSEPRRCGGRVPQ